MNYYRLSNNELFVGLTVRLCSNTQESIPLLGDPILAKASFFLETVKKVFAGLNLSFEERQVSISYFENLSWEDAFKIVEIELGLVYDLFYTKSSFVFSRAGVILRVLTCSSTIAAFVAFLFIQEGYPQTEVIVTYVLLLGAIVLEMYAILLLVLSERMVIRFGWDLREDISWLYRSRLVPARKRWSESMGQYNVIGRCLKYTPKRDVKFKYCPEMICRFIGGVKHHIETFHQYLDMKFRWKSMPVEDRLKELIYKKIKAIAEENKSGGTEIRWKKRASHIGKEDEMEFTHCVLLWHMATDIFYQKYQTTESASVEIITKRENCILLSNYMVHLLITSPVLLPRGTGHIFFKDVCARTTEFFDNQTGLCARDACEKLSSLEFENTMEGDRSKFFLKVVCKLAARLEIKGDDEAKWDDEATWDDEAPWDDEAKWERVTEVWIYMLFVAAAQCSWSDHADKLNQGGELLTHVWLLMAHFGVADLFRTSKTSFKGQMALV